MEFKNCGNNFEGNFCNNCGQSSKVDIINWKYLVNSVFSFIKDRDIAILPLFLGISYNVYVYNVLFDKISWIKRNLSLLLTYTLYFVLMMLSLSVVVLILGALS